MREHTGRLWIHRLVSGSTRRPPIGIEILSNPILLIRHRISWISCRAMDAFDLSQQSIVHVGGLSQDLISQIEDGSANGYALTLAQNRIAHVRDVSSIFQHVVQLDLSGNQLMTLDGIQALRQLEGLNISCNRISSIESLALLPKLTVLIASENTIEQIDALTPCVSLKTVNISNNNLTTWPSLGQIGTLEVLHNSLYRCYALFS